MRLSGPASRSIVEPLLKLRHPLASAQARFAEILDTATGEVLDEAVVTCFAAPYSYTTEDIRERQMRNLLRRGSGLMQLA